MKKPTVKESILKHKDQIKEREKLIQTVLNEVQTRRDTVTKAIIELGLRDKYKPTSRAGATYTKTKNKKKTNMKPNELPRKNFVNTNTLDKFREEHDYSVIIPKKIEIGIDKYLLTPEGKGAYLEDLKFRDLLGISPSVWRRYAKKFEHLQARHDGILYWGHPSIIDEMREAITNG